VALVYVDIIEVVNIVRAILLVDIVDAVGMISLVNTFDLGIISLVETVEVIDASDILLLSETTIEVGTTDNVTLSGGVTVRINRDKRIKNTGTLN